MICLDLKNPFGETQASKFALALYIFGCGFVLIALIGNRSFVAMLLVALGVMLLVAASIMWGLTLGEMPDRPEWMDSYIAVGIAGAACALFGISIRLVGTSSPQQ